MQFEKDSTQYGKIASISVGPFYRYRRMVSESVTASVLTYIKYLLLRLGGVSVSDCESPLVICRTSDDVLTVRALLKYKNHVAVAADDPKIRTELAKLGVDQITYIEQDESYETIVEDEIAVRKRINEWLGDLGERHGVPDSVMSWRRHPENDQTTQRIRDALLLIRWYRQTIHETNADHLVVMRRFRFQWEDDVLLAVARDTGIDVTVRRTPLMIIGDILNLAWIPGNVQYPILPVRLRCLTIRLRWWVRYGRLVLSRLLGNGSVTPSDDHLIGFQLASGSFRHVDNIAPVMRELEENHDFTPVGMTWGTRTGPKALRDRGLEAIELERLLHVDEAVRSSLTARAVRADSAARKQDLFAAPQLQYEGIDLGPLLWPSVRLHVGTAVPNRIGMHRSLDRFASASSLRSLKPWNGGEAGFGGVACAICDKMGIPTFFFSLGIWITKPYDQNHCDVYLVSGDYVKQNMIDSGFDPEQIVVTGKGRFDDILSFRNEYSQADSREALDVPAGFRRYIFFAPQKTVRGAISSKELIETTERLCEFVSGRSDVCLLIKPHPDSAGLVRTVVDQMLDVAEIEDVVLIGRERRPHHCINAADITVTKSSNVGIESMILQRPLLSIVLNASTYSRELYGDAAVHCTDTDEMVEFLSSVVPEADYERFKQRHLDRQKRHLDGLFADFDATETMAAAIDDISS